MAKKVKSKKYFSRIAYGGFVDGKLHAYPVDGGFGGPGQNLYLSYAIFLFKSSARKHYQDVRQILISEIISRKRP